MFYDFYSCLYISAKLFNLYTTPNCLTKLEFQTAVHDTSHRFTSKYVALYVKY